MKAPILLLFLIFSMNLSAQIPAIKSNSNLLDRHRSLALPFAENAELIITYREENIFRDNLPPHWLLILRNNEWTMTRISRTQKGTKSTTLAEKFPVNQDSARQLISLLTSGNFWNLNGNDDSEIVDQKQDLPPLADNERVYQRFEVIQGNQFRVIEYYSPDAFLKRVPELENTRKFINCRDAFLRIIKQAK